MFSILIYHFYSLYDLYFLGKIFIRYKTQLKKLKYYSISAVLQRGDQKIRSKFKFIFRVEEGS